MNCFDLDTSPYHASQDTLRAGTPLKMASSPSIAMYHTLGESSNEDEDEDTSPYHASQDTLRAGTPLRMASSPSIAISGKKGLLLMRIERELFLQVCM